MRWMFPCSSPWWFCLVAVENLQRTRSNTGGSSVYGGYHLKHYEITLE